MHPSHKDHLGKLNRVSGQVEAVKRMIDEGKYCVDIMTQIRAARSALKAVELAVLETHMKSCLDQACCHSADEQNKKIEEIVTLLKKYE
ncbi:metal-sensitive transcriptional regulator [Pseudemcibacter aquimaris]|jgi:DNA-binding FrmR family transcriptional regulator|uniref:metal-sensitive transcriptional regulator n=1 Tax=Pseudemcibacter aquimaris TaxID=2857064 RepID=UPI000147351A|nr:metal-sensitive transcriptional regulator [Pseudemcibacter aquimaris]MBI1327030.1 metal-sensing transcriptional repressor [Alphaproteobacteria bacterium]MCC3860743.1 metal-sensitive transcriptional regulator [Pseudemcibacter aquimaris]WDU59562.1 metal-sensitive transcriptional regulator [Pseudemcibacter aquimaris]|tara:strand:- start:1291 stop:1557 length:267 start_codon:yes stop_codon:yes gene_type:complete